MRVEVETFVDRTGAPAPCTLYLHGRAVDVVEIVDQWPGADYRYVKLKGDDGGLYILRFEHMCAAWELTFFAGGRAQALSAQSLNRWQRR